MNTTANKMMNAYGQAQINGGVAAASPHKLISMLYDGALVSITAAKMNMQQGHIEARGAAISKAIAIIDEGLKISVNTEAGGELSQNLIALYEYMSHRLLLANLKTDIDALTEVESLLRELKSAWESIGDVAVLKPVAQVEAEPPKVAASYGKA